MKYFFIIIIFFVSVLGATDTNLKPEWVKRLEQQVVTMNERLAVLERTVTTEFVRFDVAVRKLQVEVCQIKDKQKTDSDNFDKHFHNYINFATANGRTTTPKK